MDTEGIVRNDKKTLHIVQSCQRMVGRILSKEAMNSEKTLVGKKRWPEG